MKQDALQMTLLFDYYGELLTEKQRDLFDLYYAQDLSLTEIAEEVGISRQGVHDALAKSEAALIHFEETLGCVAKEQKLQKHLEIIQAAAEELEDTPQKARILDAVRRSKE
ncbi:MAG: YlxM family DNA-binding protein [Oscillospiraceae bacterium]|nr:YlxM family DNA-binding protein [Oscillospiraceae bacterium]